MKERGEEGERGGGREREGGEIEGGRWRPRERETE